MNLWMPRGPRKIARIPAAILLLLPAPLDSEKAPADGPCSTPHLGHTTALPRMRAPHSWQYFSLRSSQSDCETPHSGQMDAFARMIAPHSRQYFSLLDFSPRPLTPRSSGS